MQKRETFLDVLRVLATVAVVMLHTVTGVMDHTDMSGYPGQFRLFLAVMDLVCWSVPVFLMISGYLFLNPERKITGRLMVAKYCKRIALALFLFGVPFACLELVAKEGTFRFGMIGTAITMVLQGDSWAHLWYLYLIFILYLVTPLLRWILMKLPMWSVYCLQAVLLTVFSFLPFIGKAFGIEALAAIPASGIYLFYYICGYVYVVQKDEARQKNLTARIAGVILLILVVLAGRLLRSYTLQMAYNYPLTVGFAMLLFAIGMHQKPDTGEKKNTGIWEKLSALSFAVYLTHPVFLNLYYKFLHLSPLAYPIWISLPLFFLGALIPAVVTAAILRLIPVLRKEVL